MSQNPEAETCPCKFAPEERELERETRREFLRQYGDELPEDVIENMVSDEFRDNWMAKCSCDNPKEIVAACHYEPTDWFLCSVKGLAVKTELRGKGLGNQMVEETINKTKENKACLVLAADTTYDNLPSIKALRRVGFEHVGEFCWAKGKKPADILHLVRFQPTKDMTCLEP